MVCVDCVIVEDMVFVFFVYVEVVVNVFINFVIDFYGKILEFKFFVVKVEKID